MALSWDQGNEFLEGFKKSLDALDSPHEIREQVMVERMEFWFPEGEDRPAVINALKAHEKSEALFLNNRLHYQAWKMTGKI